MLGRTIRWFRQGGKLWRTAEYQDINNTTSIWTSDWTEWDGPIPDNIIIEDEENTSEEESEASKKNSLEETKRKESEGGNRRK